MVSYCTRIRETPIFLLGTEPPYKTMYTTLFTYRSLLFIAPMEKDIWRTSLVPLQVPPPSSTWPEPSCSSSKHQTQTFTFHIVPGGLHNLLCTFTYTVQVPGRTHFIWLVGKVLRSPRVDITCVLSRPFEHVVRFGVNKGCPRLRYRDRGLH